MIWNGSSAARWLLCCAGLMALSGAPARAQGARDFSEVPIVAHKIAEHFHVLHFGGTGSTVGVLNGDDGVLLVDAQFAPLASRIAETIAQFADPPEVRFLINTHSHGDHVGGNEYFGQSGALIIARDHVREQRSRALEMPDSGITAAALPVLTYEGRMTLHFNGEEIQLIAVPAAHTDGDTLVFFPGLDVIFPGDLFRSLPYPLISLDSGGTVQGTIDAMNLIIALAGPDTVIVSGHANPLSDRANAIVQRDLIITVRDRVAALVAAGKTPEEVLAAEVTAGLDPRVPQDDISVDRFVSAVYTDLAGTGPAPTAH